MSVQLVAAVLLVSALWVVMAVVVVVVGVVLVVCRDCVAGGRWVSRVKIRRDGAVGGHVGVQWDVVLVVAGWINVEWALPGQVWCSAVYSIEVGEGQDTCHRSTVLFSLAG